MQQVNNDRQLKEIGGVEISSLLESLGGDKVKIEISVASKFRRNFVGSRMKQSLHKRNLGD